MNPWPDSARFQLTPETIVKVFDDSTALVHMKTNRIHVLNQTATLIWKFICAGNSRAEIQDLLLQEFQVDESELSKEIDILLQQLQDEGLIQLQK
jgi:Coenzyme PQQ synthesis protein D (PqqD)